MGVGRCLREKDDSVKIHPIEPANSPTLSTGCKVGSHRIQGISDEFVPSIIDLEFLDDVIAVDDGDAIIMAQKLACDLGVESAFLRARIFWARLPFRTNWAERVPWLPYSVTTTRNTSPRIWWASNPPKAVLSRRTLSFYPCAVSNDALPWPLACRAAYPSVILRMYRRSSRHRVTARTRKESSFRGSGGGSGKSQYTWSSMRSASVTSSEPAEPDE